MFCLLFAVLNSSHVESKFIDIFDGIKSTSTGMLLSAKTKALYVLSYLRESNQDKIKKALFAKNAIDTISEKLRLGVEGEDELLSNVQSLGFDKKNALSALKIIENHYIAMQAIESRYAFLWNKSLEMEKAVAEVLPFLKACKLYRLYFEGHKDCLKGWELIERYGEMSKVDITDIESAVSAISIWYKNNNQFYLVKSADLLAADIAYVKKCLKTKSYQQAYPKLYSQFYSFLPALECVLDKVQMSSEYKSQWFYKTNKAALSPKKVATVTVETVAVETVAVSVEETKESNPLIQRMNPFHDFEVEQD